MKTTFIKSLVAVAICLAAVGLSSCQKRKKTNIGKDMEPLEDDEMPILDYFPLEGQE